MSFLPSFGFFFVECARTGSFLNLRWMAVDCVFSELECSPTHTIIDKWMLRIAVQTFTSHEKIARHLISPFRPILHMPSLTSRSSHLL
ncbi:hypothetical protein JAAARDRAFT_492480 [Jaapia argillacea MUCL 33604]|uniref:Uncharacterized protein n=1 Tax=Jaapia argillacea MUCL 33604 TaxID=933084 RepID=A0A067PAP9_9AGAM|nr:hypothetical protein JAAARDRAFT_492480 [Jaapia argillacea MUCL 33604]